MRGKNINLKGIGLDSQKDVEYERDRGVKDHLTDGPNGD